MLNGQRSQLYSFISTVHFKLVDNVVNAIVKAIVDSDPFAAFKCHSVEIYCQYIASCFSTILSLTSVFSQPQNVL